VLCGKLLAQLSEPSPGVWGHRVSGHRVDATPRPVTRGSRCATTLRTTVRDACAEL
jgi:hypothetical protein